ncbi:hypothetical protein DL96DRAFT_1602723 [Flagelloscypha sp. PMI_526]|nr:hypothetical protein DL96DRAFT_1602723 [Flagelloscypha sp. PMI_526]
MSSRNTAYVDIPPSPFHNYSPKARQGLLSPPSFSRKENLNRKMLPPHPLQSSPSLKRRLSEAVHSQNVLELNIDAPPAKKPKLVNETDKPASAAANCHQVWQKEGNVWFVHVFVPLLVLLTFFQAIVQCTFLIKPSSGKAHIKERCCTSKYCDKCLRNRYETSVAQAKQHTTPVPDGYSHQATYVWKCPKCSDTCNCSVCRKAKGLEPLGVITPRITPHVKKGEALQQAGVSKPKAPALSQELIEDRIFIREFILRFGHVLSPSIPKLKIEELEKLDGGGAGYEDDYIPWIGPEVVKAIVLGILGVIAAEENSAIAQLFKSAMKDIRAAGSNLTTIWGIMSALRQQCTPDDESYEEDKCCLTFPDPLPPPQGVTVHETRKTAVSSGILVAHSTQMIPVIVGLIQNVLLTSVVRQELDDGIEQAKEASRIRIELTKQENARWDELRKELHGDRTAKLKEKREEHKQRLNDLDSACNIISSSHALRFTPLGRDHDGRVYYALTPGSNEYDYAEAVIKNIESSLTGINARLKGPKKRASPAESQVDQWSWFLFVWGKPPALDDIQGFKGEESIDTDEERFWGFHKPEDIRKLGDWVAVKSGLDALELKGDVQDKKLSAVLALVKALDGYADVLEWRLRSCIFK